MKKLNMLQKNALWLSQHHPQHYLACHQITGDSLVAKGLAEKVGNKYKPTAQGIEYIKKMARFKSRGYSI